MGGLGVQGSDLVWVNVDTCQYTVFVRCCAFNIRKVCVLLLGCVYVLLTFVL